MRSRRAIGRGAAVLALLALVGTLAAPSRAGAVAAAADACPPVTSDLRFTRDLTCDLIVHAPGVTIDLRGHTLFGSVVATAGQVTLRNGTIDRGGSPAIAVWFAGGGGNRIERLVVRNAASIGVQPQGPTLITDSHFVDNGSAVDLFWATGPVTVQRSTFTGNDRGVYVAKDSGSIIRDNRFSGNGNGVRILDEDLILTSGTVISGNVFTANDVGVVLLARNHGDDTRLTDNVFRGNLGAGLEVDVTCSLGPLGPSCGGERTVVAGNRFVDNGGSGALLVHGDLAAVGGVTVLHNTAVRNAALGIDAVGVIDGGGNVGRGNGDPIQCAGVVC